MPILGVIASSIFKSSTSFESIATVTVGSGGSSSVEFTSIPGTYSHLQVRILARTNRSSPDDYLEVRFNADGTNYDTHYIDGNGSSASANYFSGYADIIINRFPASQALGNVFGSGVLDILDYKNTNKNKTTRFLGGYDDNTNGQIAFYSGLWRSTSAITSITISPGTGTSFSQYSHFALYGIKSA